MLENTAFIKSAPAGVKTTIQNAIKNFARKVREVFAMLTGGNKESRALRELKDGMYRYVDNLQKLWDVAAEEMVSGEQGEQGAETVKVEGVQFSLRNSDGNEVTLTSEEVEENKEYVANMQPVVKLTGNRFAKQQGKDFKAMALEYFGEKGTLAHSKVLGDVVIDKSGIEHLIASLTWRRSAMLPAIIPVIENGRIIYVEKNHKGYGIDTAVIAGMVNLDGKSYYMGVGIRERNDGSNGYYIHDAVTVEKRNFLPNKSGLVTAGEKAPTLAIILSDLANYNREFAKTERQYALRDTEYLSAVEARSWRTLRRRERSSPSAARRRKLSRKHPNLCSKTRPSSSPPLPV